MDQEGPEISDKVTVLVFKDNFAARVFQIPLKWISRLGISASILVLFAVLSLFLAAKYYRVALRGDPAHVQALEQEVTELKMTLKSLETHPPVSSTAPSPIPITPTSSKTPAADESQTQAPLKSSPFVNNLIFPPSSLSPSIQSVATSNIAITISSAKAVWKRKKLLVQFVLQYTREDHGNQEGKILILARGAGTLLSYPPGTLNKMGAEALFSPEKGEFFSVGHYKEVNAEFGPLPSRDSIQELAIFAFNPEGQMLLYNKIEPQKDTLPEPKPTPENEEEGNSSE